MNKRLFAQLMKSLRQGDAILRGTAVPSRRFEVRPVTLSEDAQHGAFEERRNRERDDVP